MAGELRPPMKNDGGIYMAKSRRVKGYCYVIRRDGVIVKTFPLVTDLALAYSMAAQDLCPDHSWTVTVEEVIPDA